MQTEYAKFRVGKSGWCFRCGSGHSYGWSEDGVVETASSSKYEMIHFVWLTSPQPLGTVGFVCDDCISMLVSEGNIEAYYSDLDGPMPGISSKARQAAYELGVRQMCAFLALPVREDGTVAIGSFADLPSTLQTFQSPTPRHILEIVAEVLGQESTELDPQTRGRYDAVISAALGRLAVRARDNGGHHREVV
jgi:hypothetical protein